jgi:hypothetical protein
MNTSHHSLKFELRFESLFRPGRGYAFPCDATGRVDISALNERERSGYLRARSLVGREVTVPALVHRMSRGSTQSPH